MKKIYLFIILIFNIYNTLSQVPTIEWQETIGGSKNEFFRGFIQSNDGGYILVSESSSDISGDKTENSNGNYDIWVLKVNSIGNILWQKTIGGSDYEFTPKIIQTNDGGYLLGVSSMSNISGDKTENSNGDFDLWVLKLNSTGDIEWQNTIGGNNSDFLMSMIQTNDGGYILTANSDSNISGDKTENSNGLYDIWLIKLDATGDIEWQNTIGGNESDMGMVTIQTNDGGYLLGAYSESNISGDKTENSNGQYDIWLIKLDATGDIEWQNTIGGNDNDVIRAASLTDNGGYILVAESYSDISGDKTENSNGSVDIWVLKLNSTADIEWQNTIGGSGGDTPISISHTDDDNYILGAHSNSNISGDKSENSKGNSDFWVLKLDNSGDILWQKTVGGGLDDTECSIEQSSDGGFILGGISFSDISGDKTENSNGQYDIWLIKLSQETLSINNNIFKPSIIAYPNPTDSKLIIDLGQIHNSIDVLITNPLGQKVFESTYKNTSKLILDDGIINGVNFISIKIDNSWKYPTLTIIGNEH